MISVRARAAATAPHAPRASGETLTHEKVVRGSTRLETLSFRVSEPLRGLRRRTVTAKRFGFVYKVRA